MGAVSAAAAILFVLPRRDRGLNEQLRRASRMNTTSLELAKLSTSLSARFIGVLLIAQSLLVVWAVITNQSFWVDEFGTANIANTGSISQWWDRFRRWPDSDIQMPLYHLYIFAWSKLFGFSEYALRLSNWPLFLLAEAMLLWTFRRFPLFAVVAFVLTTFHPLVWYYLDEARPYIMLFLGAVWTFASLAGLFSRVQGNGSVAYSPWIFAVGVVILAGSNMVGAFWAAAAVLLAFVVHWRGNKALLLRYRSPYIALFVLLSALAAFYAYTLARGARGVLYETNLLTVLFSAYELVGLSGFGPGRLELRSEGPSALREWLAPLLLGSTVLALGLVHGLLVLKSLIGSRRVAAVLAAVFIPALFILAAGLLMHWRVVGRHLMPAVPVVSLLLSLSVAALIAGGRRRSVLCAAIVMTAVVASGVLMRTATHAKDDYRLAAQVTREALLNGQTVWWTADAAAGQYYPVPIHLPVEHKDGCPRFASVNRDAAFDVSAIAGQCLVEMPAASVIVFSERAVSPSATALKEWIRKEGFTLSRKWPAFSLWQAQVEIGAAASAP
jgi:hypothetical protein